ncbi:alpha-L-rhamnosidase C-terminal domain-containing protein [Proteiniphilum sp.]|uniref:alpha-L-rhamnosidase-related protein n=1 Tax=Proteiniphilum sp. TaxID=1926877 RepID=UPI002B201336|nr:alpha-L-rhamnosidase C-terminal domain-containing protein [Proteiniphilum sp.]MEA4918227.1 alpha-L-rhamnosidase C-terminal domain-containing protein [Proteiniphilum sp.]
MYKKKFFLFIGLLFYSCLSHAQYNGYWIWDSTCESNTWLAFRKKIILDSQTEDVLATIAVDSKYWLWINGELVIREGGLKRTPNPVDTYADTINLSYHLKKGENTIAILVWYWGKEGHGHNGSGHGGLYFEAGAGKQNIISDSSWKVTRNSAFNNECYGPQPYRPLSEFNIVYDARKEIGEWYEEYYDDTGWKFASVISTPPHGYWGNLVVRPIPQWKDYGLKDYLNGFSRISMGNILKMKLPYNAQITPYFKIKAKAGLKVDILTDCYTDGGAYNVRAEYITKEGIQEFESPGWMSGEEVLYCFSPEIEIISLKYRESGYETEFEGSFVCDDDFYNILWQKARRTVYVNMRDNFMDCPTRERAMWWGDVVVQSMQTYYAFSPDVYKLTQKAISELMNWQTEEGILYSPIPGPHPPLMFGPYRELPLQSLAAIGQLSLGYYYLFTGDKQTLIRAYPAIKKYLFLWKLGEDGLVEHRDGKWNWGDWGNNIDFPLLDNAWYYSALESASKMAVLAGHSKDTVEYHKRMESINHNFNRLFWNGTAYRSSQHKGATDDRGNALAILSGIADRDKWKAIAQVLEQECHASPYMEKFVIEALFHVGEEGKALERMKKRYGKMVESTFSTLPEGWYFPNSSRNHGWSGGPLTLLMQYVAGIVPIEPGYKTFRVKPRLGNLKNVSATVPTKQGNIEIEVQNENMYKMKITVPKDTKACVELPDHFKIEEIYLNSVKQDNRSSIMILQPGSWIIEIPKDDSTALRISEFSVVR